MCLIAYKDKSRKTATEPVKVYKVLSPDCTGPYHDFTYRPGLNRARGPQIIENACSLKAWVDGRRVNMITDYLVIGPGFLHAYTDPFKAKQLKELHDANSNPDRPHQVVEMYIPVGTEYYENEGEAASPVLEWPDE